MFISLFNAAYHVPPDSISSAGVVRARDLDRIRVNLAVYNSVNYAKLLKNQD